MTDADLVHKKLAFIRDCLHQLRTRVDVAAVATDLKEERFAEHTLQMAIQAALDVASHVVSSRRLGEPTTNRALFALLASDGWIPLSAVEPLQAMAGFRNILVHGYAEVDPAIVQDVLRNRLGDLDELVDAVAARCD